MKIILLLAAVAVCLSYCQADDKKWEEHKEKYNLDLSGEEEETAKEHFLSNLELVAQNKKDQMKRAGKPTVGMRLNELSHLSPEQLKTGLLGLKLAPRKTAGTRKLKDAPAGKPVQDGVYPEAFVAQNGWEIPKELDWRKYGAVQPAGQQAPCGNCYIFAGLSSLESAHWIRTRQKVKLSEQYVRDCVFNSPFSDKKNNPCKGGDPFYVFQLASATPISPLADYPFQNDESIRKCPSVSHGVSINVTGVGVIDSDEKKMMVALATVGPLAGFLNADMLSSSPWTQYDGVTPAILNDPSCPKTREKLNHGVTIIGYGRDEKLKLDYWLIRNSWGPSWGRDGTFKIARGVNMCGIGLTAEFACIDGSCYPKSSPAVAIRM